MTKEEFYKILSINRENENIEFKEAKNQFSILGKTEKGKNSKMSIYAYCVAIGNMGSGKIIFGVKDKINPKTGKRDVVGTNAIQNLEKTKKEIYEKLGRKIEIEEFFENSKKIQIVHIPQHPLGKPFEFYDVPLMRNDENLVKMDKGTLTEILNERQNDFSAEICENAKIEDLDKEAIKKLRQKWIEKIDKQKNKEKGKLASIISSCSDKKLLEKLGIIFKNKPTNAAILLAGKENFLAKYFSNSEFIFEYRLNPNQLHCDYRFECREAFISAIDKIEKEINARNTRTPLKKGFFELDIWAFDLWSIREAINNAFAHRKYFNRTEPVFIKMSPDKISIKSPGGFMPGVSPENVLDIEGKWRNRSLMEALQKIGIVERSGVGLDRIFIKTISDGKGLPDFNGTNSEHVILNVPAKIRDLNFVYYLQKIIQEKQINFTAKDFIYLEKIRTEGKIEDKKRIDYFYKIDIIEKVGKSRGQRYILSKNFYEFIDKKSEYTRKKWLSKEQQKQVLLNYFTQHKKGRKNDFRELFEYKLTDRQIDILLNKLRKEEELFFDGKQRSPKAYWKIKKIEKE